MTAREVQRMGRRRVLRAAIGGAAAATAAAMAAPAIVLGANGDPVKLGEGNDATATTSIFATGPRALSVQSTEGDGLRGWTDGQNTSGVFGYATNVTSFGVYGKNGGRGVAALGTYDAALWASTSGWAAPLAVKVEGRVQLSRSGVVKVAKGARSVAIPVAPLTDATFVVATAQTYRTGTSVQCVRRIGGGLRVYLNKTAPGEVKVGWVAFERP